MFNVQVCKEAPEELNVNSPVRSKAECGGYK